MSAASPFLAVGNCTLDDVVTPDGQISPRQLGGNAVYAAAGMRLWGEDVSLVSVIGCDYPTTWLEQLAGAGIDVSGITEIPDSHLLRSRAFYFPDGSRTDRIEEARDLLPAHAGEVIDLKSEYTDTGSPLHRRIWPSFCPDLTQFADLAGKASYVHLAPGPLPCSRANATFLKELRGDQVVITFDWPWWDWDREAEVDFALLKKIDYLLPSIEELTIHADAVFSADNDSKAEHGQVFEAARRLLALGPSGIGVKMGARGLRLLLQGEKDWIQIPTYPTEAVDPTGAGDAFCGGFLVGMAQTRDARQAALYGAVSASFIIEEFGVLHALGVDADQAHSRLRHLQRRQGRQDLDA
ncbi:MAG: carbohydrate kinase family protein [Caldilineaceae bacterium SB0661_bin_32]|uniref:Carbohydrate kinase family protein n=1 Tax=Caldilineaceae bacterium SB0661_bin_32 TaxID=2605255 RepID=A0A6B1DD27_9CHLR|nr:carbohydrate kinase family protein [Caldilineaceae bacterium SB0661_bin_32]